MDEIIFEVPEGIEGCNVPVFVTYAESGLSSNDAFISVRAGEGPCSDERGLSQEEVRKAVDGSLRIAQVWMSENPGNWGAIFARGSAAAAMPLNTCRTYTWGGPFSFEVAPASFGDAGEAIELEAKNTTLLAVREDNQVYSGRFNGSLENGEYVLSNRTGGAAVPRFRSAFTLPVRTFEWTNREKINEVKRGDGLSLSWSAAGWGSGHVQVSGLFGIDGEHAGGFLCRAEYEKGTFTVPAAVIDRYRASFPLLTDLDLFVLPVFAQRLAISGVDVAEYVQPGVGQPRTIALQ
jgi:hypothetical protein